MSRTPHILIVDDEPNIGLSLRLILEREGHDVTVCQRAVEFNATRGRVRPDLILLDLRLPDGDGVELLQSLRQRGDMTPVVMISGHGTIQDALEATRRGAFDFLEKPLARDRVLLAVKNALQHAALSRENERFREIVGDPAVVIGGSAALQAAVDQARQAARSDASVLLVGESGTGKELLAELVHRESPFASGPFVKVNCAAIPQELIESELFGHEKGAFTGAASARRGRFEQAHGGTLFLDEIGDLHVAAQATLLRVLQDGEFQRLGSERSTRVSVRIVAATNCDLDAFIREGRFRADLYYRLSVVPIRVPSLRERPEDIGPLARHFLVEFCRRNNFKPKQLDAAALPLLEGYRWPGNVRELRNVVERMAILTPGDRIVEASVPTDLRVPAVSVSTGLQQARRAAERDRVVEALDQCGGNVASAARLLGVERTALHKRIKALGIERGAVGRR